MTFFSDSDTQQMSHLYSNLISAGAAQWPESFTVRRSIITRDTTCPPLFFQSKWYSSANLRSSIKNVSLSLLLFDALLWRCDDTTKRKRMQMKRNRKRKLHSFSPTTIIGSLKTSSLSSFPVKCGMFRWESSFAQLKQKMDWNEIEESCSKLFVHVPSSILVHKCVCISKWG